MPNDCWCEVRIGADPEQIELFCDTEFSFEKLRPNPYEEDPHWQTWNVEYWGTKWDRYDYKLLRRGAQGMEVTFITPWCPPIAFFEHLVETYHDVWIKCDWHDEGGYAGVVVISWDKELHKLKKVDESWEDWCLEEWVMRMREI